MRLHHNWQNQEREEVEGAENGREISYFDNKAGGEDMKRCINAKSSPGFDFQLCLR